MNANILVIVLAVEIVVVTLLSLLNFLFKRFSLKENERIGKVLKVLSYIIQLSLWCVTIFFSIWCVLQFTLFDATISSGVKDLFFAVVIVAGILFCYFSKTDKSPLWIILLQFVLILVFTDIGTYSASFSEKLVGRYDIEYDGYEYVSENIDDYNSSYFYHYYCKDKRGDVIVFSNRIYSVDVVSEDIEKEYYEMYNRAEHIKIEGIGCYINTHAKPLVVIHAKKK